MRFNQAIKIGNRIISDSDKTFIIAEAGVNHNGDMDTARQMIDAAVNAGADAVKFQTFKTDHLILKGVEKAPYQRRTTDSRESQYEMLKRLEVTKEQTRKLMSYCNEAGILFLSTPFESVSLDE